MLLRATTYLRLMTTTPGAKCCVTLLTPTVHPILYSYLGAQRNSVHFLQGSRKPFCLSGRQKGFVTDMMTAKQVIKSSTSNEPVYVSDIAPMVKDQALSPHPYGLDWEQHLADIQSLTLHHDDVIICAYPKAGTHWLWEVCHMLHQGDVQYVTRSKEHLMMEFVSKDTLAKEDPPRIFNTHLYFSLLVTEQIKQKKVKLVHVYRNPKDTVVSMFFHYRQKPGYPQDLREFVQLFLRGEVSFGDYVRYLQQMETFMKENPDHPVLNVSFEETKRDPVGVVMRLAELMQVDASEKLCEDIAVACSFQKMKMVDDTLKKHLETPVFTFNLKLYRKGEVGDWKNYLTVAESEMIDKYIAEGLKDCTLFKLEYE